MDPMESLVDEREADMMSSVTSHQPIKRKAFFLKPTSALNHDSLPPPHNAISSDIQEPPNYKARLRWWADPQKQWEKWVEKIEPTYKHLWKAVGIYDAIKTSTYKFKRDPSSLWGVTRFWCEETNTFVFPWAEATVTLEDVMVLGGFSVLGEPVRIDGPLDGKLGDIESEIIDKYLKPLRKMFRKVEHHVWIRYCTEKHNGDELDHVAFLSLWLSRYVLRAGNGKIIRKSVIQIACRLALGIRVALAPAVLASIYRDLRAMKDQLTNHNAPPLYVWAPLNILQLWIWERFFLYLQPVSKRAVSSDEPRAAAWRGMQNQMDFLYLISVYESPDKFHWRPYSINFDDHCCKTSIYKDNGNWICSNVTEDEEVQSLARFLRDCELVGLDCIEQYLPHRVAMQFGFDQDIPKVIPRANSTWKQAWKTYDIRQRNVKFYVPSRLSETAVTQRCALWWKKVKSEETAAGKKRHTQLPLPRRKKKKAKTKAKDFDDYRVADYAATGYQDIDATQEIKVETENKLLQEFVPDELTMTENSEANCEMEEMEKVTAVRVKELVEAKCRVEEMKEHATVRMKELRGDWEIGNLKEEIAVLHEIAMDLEYLTEMYSKSELVSWIS